MSALGEHLKSKGFVVNDQPVYGRASTWQGVKWLMVHHYAGSESTADSPNEAKYAKTGTLFPPICQLYLDLTGKVWVISKERDGQSSPGRANHAGAGSYPGISKDKGNEVALGIEVQCDGKHPLRNHQVEYEVLIRLLAELCRRHGLDESKVIGHKEYAPDRKVDPRDDMAQIRREVGILLGNVPITPPPPVKPPPPPPVKPPPPATWRQDKKVYESKMAKGQADSDSVWNVTAGLKEKGYWTAAQTDDYTQAVVDAVAKFQRAQGWSGSDANGIVGPTTAARLGGVWVDETPPPPPASPWASGDVYLSKLRYGQQDSDSVKRLQYRLNAHRGLSLPITGNYSSQTDNAVRGDQIDHGRLWGEGSADPVNGSNVGPKQASHLFGSSYTIKP